MRSLTLFLGCILLSTLGYCQLKNVTFKIAPNYSFIGSVAKAPREAPANPSTGYTYYWSSTDNMKEAYETKPGFDFSSSFDVFSFGKFYIHSGIGVQLLRFKRNLVITDTSNPMNNVTLGTIQTTGYPYYGMIYGTSSTQDPDGSLLIDALNGSPSSYVELAQDPKVSQTTVVFLQVPVMIGRKFFNERFRMQVGVVPSALVRATRYEQLYSFNGNGGVYTEIKKNKSRDGYTNFLINGAFETSYFITKNIGVTLGYQRSFSPIFEAENRTVGKTYFNSVSLGVSYQIGK